MGRDVGKGKRRLRRRSCGEAIVGCGTPSLIKKKSLRSRGVLTNPLCQGRMGVLQITATVPTEFILKVLGLSHPIISPRDNELKDGVQYDYDSVGKAGDVAVTRKSEWAKDFFRLLASFVWKGLYYEKYSYTSTRFSDSNRRSRRDSSPK